jgi:membrane protease YdiL (CAAX protease family)
LLGLALVIPFFLISVGGDRLEHILDPATAARVDQATGHYYAGFSGPGGLAILALLPAVCEETLFRGALQPRLGIVLAGIGFAALHPQYGFSLDVAIVLVLGLGLGLLRRYTQTTSSILTHAGYNFLAAAGPGSAWLLPAIVVEMVLAGATLVAWLWTRRSTANP